MDIERKHQIRKANDAMKARDYVRALATFRDVLKEHPGYADVHHSVGLCLSFLGQPQAALAEFDQALAVNGGYVEAHLNRAITLNELGRFDEAAEAFEQAGIHEESSGGRFSAGAADRLALAHADLGDLYLQAGALEEAVEQLAAAVELRPSYPDLRHRLALALLRSGDLDEAERHLRHALETDASFTRARADLGMVYYRRGDRDRARAEWEECRARNPANPQVRAYISMFEYDEAAEPSAADSSTSSDSPESANGG